MNEKEILETIEGTGGLRAHIYQDEDPSNPRDDDNLGRIATVNLSRHHLADEGEAYLPEDLSGWDEVEGYLRRERQAVVILPVYLYDHSMISIGTETFVGRAHHASWDSGQVGFIYATKNDILDNFMAKNLTERILAHTKHYLEGEIKIFDQFLRGEVYGYQVVRKCPDCGRDDHADLGSCWGYYGVEEAREAAMAALEAKE